MIKAVTGSFLLLTRKHTFNMIANTEQTFLFGNAIYCIGSMMDCKTDIGTNTYKHTIQ